MIQSFSNDISFLQSSPHWETDDEDQTKTLPLAPRIYHHNSQAPGKKIHDYEWTFLLVVREFSRFLLARIMYCFQLLINQFNHAVQQETEKAEEITKCFNIEINYEKFRDKILSYKRRRDNALCYNNYDSESYNQLKNSIINHQDSRLGNCTNDNQKNLIAGIAVYDAIVDLYVHRFLHHYPEMNREPNLSVLRFIALCIAIKVSHDEPCWSSDFRAFIQVPFSVKVQKGLELEFLKTIDWDLSLATPA